MKKIFALAILAAITSAASADVYHRGYYRNNGTYVQPHYQTVPNGTQRDNYGSTGVYNPHNGEYGTRTPRY